MQARFKPFVCLVQQNLIQIWRIIFSLGKLDLYSPGSGGWLMLGGKDLNLSVSLRDCFLIMRIMEHCSQQS